ncbi:MAG: sugar ABC transporter substrate-binding protein [Alphaproteobacteria bacterium]|nr:MAG: sugar ABC transporter substrate-binding protein [Alphaproteobacteria bacterium]
MAANARRYRLAVFTKNRKNPAYVGARLGADRVAARHGCVVTHYVPDKPDDVDEQHALLEAAYAERPDALLIAPAHATALNGTLRRMQADGIPLLCFVSRPEEISSTCFVGSDDRALARGIADYLFDRLDGGGDVVTLEGHPIAITTAPRAAGFRDAARARKSIRIVDSRPGYFLRDGGHAGMTELLAAQPRIDGVLAANDFMALGALDAMRETGRKIQIVGVNATPEGVQAIKAGDMLASASFDAMKMACLGVEAAVRVLSGERVPAEILLPVEVVDRTNCAAWDLPYEQRPLPEWSAYVRG